MQIHFEDYVLSSKWTSYDKHPDLKVTAEGNYPLYCWAVDRVIKAFYFSDSLKDNVDLFFFPYLRGCNAWLFSDKSRSLSTYVEKQFSYFISECKRYSTVAFRKSFYDMEEVRLDVVSHFADDSFANIVPDILADTVKIAENRETLEFIGEQIDYHIREGGRTGCNRKWTNVSWWAIYKMYITAYSDQKELFEECKRRGYIKDGVNAQQMRKILYYCREQLKKENRKENGEFSTTD